MPEDQRPATTQDLVRHLVNTLVDPEVMAPMESINWGNGTPPPPQAVTTTTGEGALPPAAPGTTQPAQGQPLPAAPVTGTAAVSTDAPQDVNAMYESMREANGLILGKYATVADAVRGVGHAVTMAKTAFSQRDQLQKDLDRLTAELNQSRLTPPAASPAPVQSQSRPLGIPSQESVTKAQANYDAVLSQIVEDGGVLDAEAIVALSKANSELVDARAKFVAEESQLQRDAAGNAENEKWNAVDAYMNEHYPDAKNFSDEITLFVQSDPLVASAVQALALSGKEKEASALAWRSFDLARGGNAAISKQSADAQKEIHLQAADQVRKEAVEAARKDAGIISSSASGVHDSGQIAPSQVEIDAAAAAMRAYGTQPGNPAAARWRALTIGKDLPDHIFGS